MVADNCRLSCQLDTLVLLTKGDSVNSIKLAN